ncbi:energy-coupling factor transporter ATPase [Tindallia californiensis]|uniref:Energy-coupling factor transporter ATP-binding protein EcfA2 n=1 Tax=Tindallia californiensis TaxID=159292 RepID=A0A1H3QYU2_9FIRM|nr:energy-coupling factor transporter ATPase [Tindallia californiensis]SDZ18536.1 energy-coupling factor transport system ATP-binding protein [Tindallia californiensis]
MSIKIENVNHIYNPGSPFQANALSNINLEIKKGEFVGLIGHTGSGKSTLVQHLNGLLRPTSGSIWIDDQDITASGVKMKDIRKKVGLVFQYPEHQLFEESVYKDIAFGPINLGLASEEINDRVKEAMALVNLSFEDLKDRSPFDLSGGQRRRVAVAGVLAMKPEILILDEPTASLDPRGRDEILDQIQLLHQEYQQTVILVSHSMEDVGRLVERIIVMDQGEIALIGKPGDIFAQSEKLEKMSLGVPQISMLMKRLNQEGHQLPEELFTVEDAKMAILKWLRRKDHA